MLKSVVRNTMSLKCDICGHEFEKPVPNISLRFLSEFNEYENLAVQCPNCNGYEIFNMNIPPDDTDEPFRTGDLPLREEIQRYYVRLLMRHVRKDLK